ncbi:serine/threonine protein kinase [Kribbella rubisoli]|uniref:Serine/threonine protein kinase n=1 Tax=Kribbella rubisoli TaxID=3075929 RepID=A0A4Q7WUE5_9ACTN|nr:serine/threonine-protein kinase [Kribbella rubisoli]RZU13623.1 serine/threonine protein kinase [Kribbella rubisoli]
MTTHPHDPAVVGSFAIQGRLGRGAMGAVYLARSPGGRLVAVKVVRDELAGDSGFRARFAREIDAARKVSGAFTAAVVDADPDADRPWLATEYLPGPTLQKAIETSGPLSPAGVQSLASGLAEALMAIHASGVVHRDLKPSNIVLTDNGPRVIDFGIARALEEASLTATGMVIGTPGYLSPEQITGTGIGSASDLFALGAVLVFAASGRGPFATGNPASMLHRIVNEHPQIPPLPGALHDVVRRCLARDPAQRPTPLEILQLLGQPVPTALLNPPTIVLPSATRVLPPTAGQDLPPVPTPLPAPPGAFAQAPTPSGPPAQGGVVGASFATSRVRAVVFAVVTTVLCLAFASRDPEMQVLHPIISTVLGLVSLTFLYFAIRHWILVLRPKVVLRLSPQGLTINRAYREATIPWYGVTRLHVGGDSKRPWLIAWLEPQYQNQLPVSHRRHHGGLRIYPIAHGATHGRRQTQVNELRAALNWYAGRIHDNSY